MADKPMTGRALGTAICQMLGIPANDVRSISVFADYKGLAEVTVTKIVRTPEGRALIEANAVKEITEKFKLTSRDDG